MRHPIKAITQVRIEVAAVFIGLVNLLSLLFHQRRRDAKRHSLLLASVCREVPLAKCPCAFLIF